MFSEGPVTLNCNRNQFICSFLKALILSSRFQNSSALGTRAIELG